MNLSKMPSLRLIEVRWTLVHTVSFANAVLDTHTVAHLRTPFAKLRNAVLTAQINSKGKGPEMKVVILNADGPRAWIKDSLRRYLAMKQPSMHL